jgi:hypothetical protein
VPDRAPPRTSSTRRERDDRPQGDSLGAGGMATSGMGMGGMGIDGCTANPRCGQIGLLLGGGCETAINTIKGIDASFAMLCDGM